MLVFVIIPSLSIVAGESNGFGMSLICWENSEGTAVNGMAAMLKTIRKMRTFNAIDFLTVIDSSETHSNGKIFIIYIRLTF